jgi:hypothetical protein
MYHRWFTLVAVTLALLLSTVMPAAAQSGSPVASPVAAPCDAPALPPGTPSAMEDMEMGGMDMATPEGEASPAADDPGMMPPAASPVPAGTPADEATSARVIAAIENVINCYNTGDYLGLAALFTPAGLEAEFGVTNPYDMEYAAAGGPPLLIDSISNVQVHDDGRYSAELVASFGGAQISREQWVLVEEGDYLLVDETPDLPVEAPEGAITVEAAMVDFAFELSETTVPADQPLVFEATNMGEYPHELVIVQLPDGATVDQVLEGSVNFEEIAFFGATYSEGGEPAPDLVLSGLPAGTYTLVCFVDIPDGIPHVARGMVAELVVD